MMLIMPLTGKTALITGGLGRFGQATARLMARDGADVVLADVTVPDPNTPDDPLAIAFARTKAHIESLGRRVFTVKADVTQEAECEQMADEARAHVGDIDILCANAGTFTYGPSWELTTDDWSKVMDVNMKGVWLTTKYVVPSMIKRRYGKVIITSSRDGLRAEPNFAHYCASKFGVIGYMKSLAIELGPFGINVNAVCPTQMATRGESPPDAMRHPYWDQVTGQQDSTYAEFDRASGQENMFEGTGQPDFSEIAEGVVWLASDRSHMVTGHALPMDAGWIAKRGG
jgi:(+)-trans-carveol dehydrogenase